MNTRNTTDPSPMPDSKLIVTPNYPTFPQVLLTENHIATSFKRQDIEITYLMMVTQQPLTTAKVVEFFQDVIKGERLL